MAVRCPSRSEWCEFGEQNRIREVSEKMFIATDLYAEKPRRRKNACSQKNTELEETRKESNIDVERNNFRSERSQVITDQMWLEQTQ